MQGFEIYAFLLFMQKFKMATKNGGKTIFWKKLPDDFANTLGVKNFPKIALSRTISKINAFLGFIQKIKMAIQIAISKNFVKIALSRTISEITTFLCFTPKFKIPPPPKNGGKRLCRHPKSQKFCRKHLISHHFRDKCIFEFYAEIQDGRQKWWENDFSGKKAAHSANAPGVKNLVEIALSPKVSEINAFAFYAQIQHGCQKFLGKNR